MTYDANCITLGHILENKHDGINKREMRKYKRIQMHEFIGGTHCLLGSR